MTNIGHEWCFSKSCLEKMNEKQYIELGLGTSLSHYHQPYQLDVDKEEGGGR